MPTPPTPAMATSSPGLISAVCVAEPQPVVTPQPTRQATSNGIDLSIGTTEDSCTTMYGEKVPSRVIGNTGLPSVVWIRWVPSAIATPPSSPAPRSQRLRRPA